MFADLTEYDTLCQKAETRLKSDFRMIWQTALNRRIYGI